MHSENQDAKRSVYQFAFEHSRDPLFVLSAGGRIVERNRAARALPEDWLQHLFPGVRSTTPEVEGFHRDLATHGHAHIETVVGRRTVALDGHSDGEQHLVTVRDVTDGRELEAERRTLRRIESIGHLTVSLAHDFNNLLTPILSLGESLETQLPPGGTTAPMARDIRDAAERALALVRQTLRLVRREPSRVEAVSVNAVVSDLRTLLERVVGREVEVGIALGADPCVATVDRERLEHVLLNLAANARDAMPSGGRLHVSTATVTLAEGDPGSLEGATAGTYVALRVSDNGMGMTSDVRERIFERFFTTKAEGRGTGLGLSAVQRFVVESGGCLALHSQPDRGTTLAIYLPRAGA